MNETQDNRGYEGKTNYGGNPRLIIRILDDVNSQRDDRGTETDVGQDIFTSLGRSEMDGYDADGFNATSRWLLDNRARWGK